jgi:Uma2 family endonuclease
MLDRRIPATGWTVADVVALDGAEGMRFELHEGVLLVVPPPSVPHQRVERDLLGYLTRGKLEPIQGIGIVIDGANYRVPDISVLRAGAEPDESVNEQSAAIVEIAIEVVSPTSGDTDRILKPAVYARAGIPQYWRVEPTDDGYLVFMYELRNGAYALAREVPVEELLAENP